MSLSFSTYNIIHEYIWNDILMQYSNIYEWMSLGGGVISGRFIHIHAVFSTKENIID